MQILSTKKSYESLKGYNLDIMIFNPLLWVEYHDVQSNSEDFFLEKTCRGKNRIEDYGLSRMTSVMIAVMCVET